MSVHSERNRDKERVCVVRKTDKKRKFVFREIESVCM